MALVGIYLSAPASAAIISGAVSDINSTADLDLDNIIYAVNLGGSTSDQTVGGVTFSGTGAAIPGVTLTTPHTPGPASGFEADLDGGGAGEDALEAVLNNLTFGTPTNTPIPLIVLDTDSGVGYRLQLLIYDAGYSGGRNFDILVDGALVVENEAVGLGSTPGVSNLLGRLYTLDFTADADETQVTFDFGVGPTDSNPVVSGVTLATAIPKPSTLALGLIFGLAGLGRRRSK